METDIVAAVNLSALLARAKSGRCVAVALVLTACGSSSTSSTASAAKGPATINMNVTGDAGGISGPLTATTIDCNFPTLHGTEIFAFGHLTDPALSMQVRLQSGKVTVFLDSGSGSKYQSRAFTGTGVTGFDAAKGAQVDSKVTEMASGATPGTTLGHVASIKGSVDCGNQAPGTTTFHITGTTSIGNVNSGLSPALVICHSLPASSGGDSITVSGIGKAGSAQVSIFVAVQKDHFTIGVAGSAGGGDLLTGSSAGTATLNGNTVHIDATATVAGKPSSLTVKGDATCGFHS
jgi:hypothetical protein